MLKVLRSTVHTDSDADGAVDAGEVLTHTITIENKDPANPATGVVVSDTLAGSTLVPGSMNISPIAFNDAYSAVGNTLLLGGGFANPGSGQATSFSGKVTDNDVDFLGDVSMKVSAVTDGVSANGGTFNLAADGSFSYISAAGFEGTDSFTYTLRDAGSDGVMGNVDDLTSVGTVTIAVSQSVWYVDSSAAAGGNGTSTNPFNSLNPLTTGGTHDGIDDAGDIIYVKGTHSGGILLETDQQLIGAGAGFTTGALTIADTGTQATLNYSGVGVQLATGNTIKGIDLVGTAASAIGIGDGNGTVGTLTVSDVGISGQGQIVDIDQGGTLNVTLNSAASTGSAGFADGSGAIDLNTVNGTFTVTGATSITGGSHSGGGIDITNNSALTVNLQGNVTVNTGGNVAINFSGNAGASQLNMSGASKDIDTTTGTALNFTNNNTIGTGTVSITGGGLDIDTQSGTGLNITSTILNVTGALNTINTTSGVIFAASTASLGASGATFDTLGSSSSAVSGTRINVNDLDGGSTFTASNVSIAGTTTSGDGILIAGGSNNAFNFGTVTVGATAGDGVELNGANGAVTFTSLTVNGSGEQGLEINGATSSVTVTAGNIGNIDDAAMDGVLILGGTGAVTIGAAVTKTSAGHVVEVNNHETGNVTFSGAISSTGTSNGLLVDGVNTGVISFSGQTALSTGANAAVTLTNNGGGTINFAAGGNGLDITTTTGAGFTATGGGTVNVTGSGNTISSGSGTALSIRNTNIGASDLTFQSISSSGGTATAIILDTTGNAGGLTVTGTGSTLGSGGTISNKSETANGDPTNGTGIYLNNTSDVSLNGMILDTFQNFAIRGINVSNFSFTNSHVKASSGTIGNDAATDEGAVKFGAYNQVGLTGSATFNNVIIEDGYEDNLDFKSNSGSLNATISNSTFKESSVGGGVVASAYGTYNMTFTVNDINSSNNSTRGISILTNESSSANVSVGKSGVAGSGGTYNDNFVGAEFGHNSTGTYNFKLYNASVGWPTYSGGSIGININRGGVAQGDTNNPSARGLFQGIVEQNTVSSPASAVGYSMRVATNGYDNTGSSNTTTLRIANNTLTQLGSSGGLQLIARDGNNTLNATVLNNNISVNNSIGLRAIDVTLGAITADSVVANLDIAGNTATWSHGVGIRLHRSGLPVSTTSIGRLEDYAGGASDQVAMETYLAARNTATVDVTSGGASGTGWVNINDVPEPTIAILAAAPGPAAEQSEEELPEQFVDTPEVVDGSSGSTDGTDQGNQQHGQPIPSNDEETSAPPQAEASFAVIDDGVLTQAELDFIVEAAIQRWIAAGATAEQVAAMRATVISVENLSGLYLGQSGSGTITLDDNAAGWSWFVDGTPGDDSEFSGSGTQLVAIDKDGVVGARIDLLTVVMHELGHQIGLTDTYASGEADELMYGTIRAGERRLPGADDAPAAGPAPVSGALAIDPITIGTIPAGQTVTIKFKSVVDTKEDGLVGPFTQVTSVTGTNAATTNDSDLSDTFATVDSLTLGNLVFLDANKNGTYDAGTDSGISGVTLSLFADSNNNGVYDEGTDLAVTYTDTNNNGIYDPGTDTVGGSTVLTVTSGANGLYAFSNLAAGDYIVRVNASNFANGGALFGKSTTTGETDPDDNVDNDDNGVAASGGIVVSKAIRLDFNSEPTAGAGNDTNNTLDLGFVQPNQAPAFTNLGGDNVTYTENGAPVRLDAGTLATIGDSDSANFDGGSLTVVGNVQVGDRLIVDNSGSVSLAENAADPSKTDVYVNDGTSTLLIGTAESHVSGSDVGMKIFFNANATPARVQELVRAVYVDSISENPSTVTRTYKWTLVDGDGRADGGDDDTTVSGTVTVISVNDAPAGADNGAGVVEGQALVFTVAHFSTGMTDAESHAFAGVKITTLPSSGTIFFDADGAGGNAPVAISAGAAFTAQQIADGKLSFVPASASGGTAPTFTFQVQDNGGTANGGVEFDQTPNTFTVTVSASNQAPVVDLNGAGAGNDAAAGYTEDGAAVAIGASITVTDPDAGDQMASATITVSDAVSGDALSVSGALPAGITIDPSSTATVLKLIGAASTADYQTAIAQVRYATSNQNPTAGGSDTQRTITTVLNDGNVDSNAATTTVTITAVNDAPVNTAPAARSGTEDTDLVFSSANGNAVTVSDADGSGNLTVTLGVGQGRLTLSTVAGLSFAAGDGTADATMTFSGTAAAINAALNGLIYRGNLNYSGADTLSLTTSDNGDSGTGGTLTDTDTVAITLTADGKINGTSGNDTLGGTGGGDLFYLQQGGDDSVSGGGGDDAFLMGASLSAGDSLNGGEGSRDQVGLQGNYAGLTLGATTLSGIEQIGFLSGADTRFGAPGNQLYSYNLTMHDGNVLAGQQLVVQFNSLLAGENVTFDGSAEQDGYFFTYGGQGTDVLIGGQKNDRFFFGADGRWGANDRVDGQGGTDDQLGLQGDYSGTNAVVFRVNSIVNIEMIGFLSAGNARYGNSSSDGYSYTITMNDANVAAGTRMFVQANDLKVNGTLNEILTFDGSAETNGSFTIYSGQGADVIIGSAGNDEVFAGAGADRVTGGFGADTLRGGDGSDSFIYLATSDSTAASRDSILGFESGDRIDLSAIDAFAGGGDDAFAFIGSAAFTAAGQVRVVQNQAGGWLMEADVNGDGVADLSIGLTTINQSYSFTSADFIL